MNQQINSAEKYDDYYKIFIDILNNSTTGDKITLTFLRLVNIIIILIVVFGFLVPKHLLLWHCVLCFIVLTIIISNTNYGIDTITYNILKKNNTNNIYTDEELLIASKTVPFKVNTCKIIIFISMILSIFGYFYPEYSGSVLLKKIQNKLDEVDNYDHTELNLNTEFKSNEFKYNLVTDDNILNDKVTDSINIDNVDMNLSIFNNIKPIELKPIIAKPIIAKPIESNLVNLDNLGNMKNLEFNKPKLANMDKMLKSLREFNDILLN